MKKLFATRITLQILKHATRFSNGLVIIYFNKNNMRKIIVSEHITLDGFVAGPNGEMDWIQFDDEMFDWLMNLLTPQTLHCMAAYIRNDGILLANSRR